MTNGLYYVTFQYVFTGKLHLSVPVNRILQDV